MGNLMAKRNNQLTIEIRIESKPISGTSSTFTETKSTVEGTISPDGSILMFVGHNSRCTIIPDDVWLHIFSYLSLESLCMVAKVCDQWKQLIDVHLESRRHLTSDSTRVSLSHTDVLRVLNRCGMSLRQLTIITDANKHKNFGKVLMMIGDHCPNLVSLSLLAATTVDSDKLKSRCVKCNKDLDMLVSSSSGPTLTCESFGFLLKSMKQLKRLRTNCPYLIDGNHPHNHVGPMLEELDLEVINSAEPLVLYLCGNLKNLRKLSLHFMSMLDNVALNGSCQAWDNLKELSIKYAPMKNMKQFQISIRPCLEKFDLSYPVFVDNGDDNNIEILFHGCSDLKAICLVGYDQSRISSATENKIFYHCQQLLEPDLSHNNRMSDSAVGGCRSIKDIGCDNFVIKCNQLQSLDIRRCCHFNDAIVAPSLEAVRRRLEKLPLLLMVAGFGLTNTASKNVNQIRLVLEN